MRLNVHCSNCGSEQTFELGYADDISHSGEDAVVMEYECLVCGVFFDGGIDWLLTPETEANEPCPECEAPPRADVDFIPPLEMEIVASCSICGAQLVKGEAHRCDSPLG